jgi:LysR family transcriptional regulator, regulator for bpeEF and oprC
MRFLRDMALFVEVANTRNFSRAATALGVPASTLSRRISALEQELGTPLIHRSTRSFQLTEAGQAFYEQAKTVVGQARRIQEELTAKTAPAPTRLRVGVPFDLAQTIVLPLLPRLLYEQPWLGVEVVATTGHPNLLTESLDVALLVGHQLRMPDSRFTSRRVGSFARLLFASQKYLAAHPKLREPEDLGDHACLCLVHGEPLRTWELRRERERRRIQVTGAACANSVGMLARMANGGLGVALLPEFLAAHPGFGGGLVPVLRGWEGVPAHVFAITPSRLQSLGVRRLIKFLGETFQTALDELTPQRR